MVQWSQTADTVEGHGGGESRGERNFGPVSCSRTITSPRYYGALRPQHSHCSTSADGRSSQALQGVGSKYSRSPLPAPLLLLSLHDTWEPTPALQLSKLSTARSLLTERVRFVIPTARDSTLSWPPLVYHHRLLCLRQRMIVTTGLGARKAKEERTGRWRRKGERGPGRLLLASLLLRQSYVAHQVSPFWAAL